MNEQNILIELDALMDTRLGALSQISTDIAARVMRKDYWERASDRFGDLLEGAITNEAYQEVYARRGEGIEVLKASGMTNMPQLLGPMTRALQHQATRKVDVGAITATINVWPYKLEPLERETFADALGAYLALSTQVKTVSLSPEELTPRLLFDKYDLYVIYNYDDWDMAQREALIKSPIPQFTMMIPQLFKKLPTKEDLINEDGQEMDPFKVFQLVMLEFLAIEVQPVFFYSLVKP